MLNRATKYTLCVISLEHYLPFCQIAICGYSRNSNVQVYKYLIQSVLELFLVWKYTGNGLFLFWLIIRRKNAIWISHDIYAMIKY